ncbi:MAG: hypothetical protein NNA20_11400 [Nitrospira sp.]|nr:hypothetical protein [Nitrospira sp.]
MATSHRRLLAHPLSHGGRVGIPSLFALWTMQAQSPSPLVGEGLGRGGIRHCLHDRRQHALQITYDLVIPEPQHREPLLAQPVVPLFVMRRIVVLSPICFHDQARSEVDEINDVGANRLLASEFLAIEPMCPQMPP